MQGQRLGCFMWWTYSHSTHGPQLHPTSEHDMKLLRDRAQLSQTVTCQCSEPNGSSFIDKGAADVSMPVPTDENVCFTNSDQTHTAQNFARGCWNDSWLKTMIHLWPTRITHLLANTAKDQDKSPESSLDGQTLGGPTPATGRRLLPSSCFFSLSIHM